jgi:hypothetical protein
LRAANQENENSTSTNTQRVRHAIDVIKPGRNQRYLKDCTIVEPYVAQTLMILFRDARRVPR